MEVRSDDGRALERAWSVYEAWLCERVGCLPTGAVLAIGLARPVPDDALVPSVDVYVEDDGSLLASATGNSVLGARYRIPDREQAAMGISWSAAVRDRRGVVLWELRRGPSEVPDLAVQVRRVLARGYGVTHPVLLATQVDGVAAAAPDWRLVHCGSAVQEGL
ncbi:hypothetical protein OO014_09805 [Intrasporangium calvum]|uniref:TY-Chap N-terminal domain-containing protein n=1 Tax=Intrasporangium calvum TaxID=53358 RepID=A0ABT5GH29_9MICO|nr:hypothetical protein [Intrasporangium calvum]MDC5697551.1 hypothetical protein [Intrasporangium calvum]